MTNLQKLTELKWHLDCSNTKMRPDYVPKDKFTDKTANGLTKAVITWIKLHGYQAERINTTGRYIEGKTLGVGFYGVKQTKGKYIKGTGTNGSADISATIKGKSIKIEVKIGADRQSEAQKKYQADIERAGGIYIIVKNFDQFVDWYNNFL